MNVTETNELLDECERELERILAGDWHEEARIRAGVELYTKLEKARKAAAEIQKAGVLYPNGFIALRNRIVTQTRTLLNKVFDVPDSEIDPELIEPNERDLQ